MKLIVEVESQEERSEIENLLKNLSGKISMKRRHSGYIESLLLFAERNRHPVDISVQRMLKSATGTCKTER